MRFRPARLGSGRLRSPIRALAVCAVLSTLLLGYAHLGSRFAFAGAPVRAAVAPPLDLTTDRDERFSLAGLLGHAVLVYFGYTHCPDVCPTTLGAFGPVFRRLGAASAKASIVFVTLDPQHDTPQALHAYLKGFDPTPIGLSGSPASVAAAAKAWRITWERADGGFINHTSAVMLVGPDGRLRARYGFAQLSDADGIARDIRHVLHLP